MSSPLEETALPFLPYGTSITAVITAYNASGRIGQVLATLRDVEALSGIIVVDDGSTDDTVVEVARAASVDPRIRCLSLPVKGGKGAALFAGARAAPDGILLFLDADLIGLTPAHVQALVASVCAGDAEMTIGVFHDGHRQAGAAHRLTLWLSGQCCLPAEHFFQVLEQDAVGYGIETAITQTARRRGWRCQRVPLDGISHPFQEERYGYRSGLKRRAPMRRQIWQTVWTKRNRWLPSTRRKLALLLLAFIAIFAYNYDRTRAFSTLRPEDVPLLPLAAVQRLLVISPHPDDETLGAAGAIQQALEAGADVKVVLITNGDGQAVAPLVLQRRVRARAEDYIQSGEQRQTETVSALRLLGVPSDSVLFLGYPDGLINQLWINDWTGSCPLRARYTRALYSLYPTTFNSQATYCGRDLLDDLQTIIENYRPDLVLLPHPNDDHPDHRASHNFTRLALALVAEAHPDYRPDVWGYLVHYGLYPQPRGRRPHDSLRPPSPLTGSQNQWARMDLTPDQVKAKAAAVQAYPTQLRLLGSFLPSFVRQNELFTRLYNLDLSPLALVDLPVNASGLIESPAVAEPADESTRQLVMGSADLIGLHVARLDNLLWLTAETRHSLFRGIRYTLMVKLPNGDTLTAAWPGDAVRLSRNTFTFPLNLDEIGDPDVLGFAAEVRQGVVLDHSAWHFITLHNRLP